MISAMAFLGVSTTVLYTACEKDSCVQLKCQNDAPCVDGFCVCKEGFEGVECREFAADRFTGHYIGSSVRNDIPYVIDSADVKLEAFPNHVNLMLYSDFKAEGGDDDDVQKVLFKGKIEGNRVITRDEVKGTYFEMVEDNDKITVYMERTVDGKLTTVSFQGTKEKK
jgi:hypothetical protein